MVYSLMTRQLMMLRVPPLKASSVLAEKPAQSDDLQGYGLLLQLKKRKKWMLMAKI
jgi:hypothetical protein